jgi:hypothetical protein
MPTIRRGFEDAEHRRQTNDLHLTHAKMKTFVNLCDVLEWNGRFRSVDTYSFQET